MKILMERDPRGYTGGRATTVLNGVEYSSDHDSPLNGGTVMKWQAAPIYILLGHLLKADVGLTGTEFIIADLVDPDCVIMSGILVPELLPEKYRP